MIYQLFWLFLAFSFCWARIAAPRCGWGHAGTAALHGPAGYGITGCLITIACGIERRVVLSLLFSACHGVNGCRAFAGALQPHPLVGLPHRKWNLDGYICLSASVWVPWAW
ncbi:MAG: hypothetical protein ACLTGG_08835 [Subdoligranulum sp.]